jgi:GNAT superfamily N-acetyltransferase
MRGVSVRVQTAAEAELPDFPGAWPVFMYHDAVSAALYDRLISAHPEYSLVAFDGAEPVAKATTFPFTADLADLPDGGYDAIILGAAADLITGRSPTVVGAVEVAVRPDRRGEGLSRLMLAAMRANCRKLGFAHLVAPVRPNQRADTPSSDFAEYVARTTAEGLPRDAWLRTHVRLGGTLGRVAPRSMTITGTLPEWRAWTGLPFDTDGPVRVPGALVPVECSLARNQAVYLEPNVWVTHVV